MHDAPACAAGGLRFVSCATLVLLAALGTAGCEESESGGGGPKPPRVSVRHPEERELLDEDTFGGWLRASQTVEVRARVRGHIKAIHFQDGDRVKADQLLFELDPDPFQVLIDQAKAQAGAYRAQQVAAEKDVARYTELVKSGGATRQQLEKAEADAAAYSAQIAAMQEEVKRNELDLKYSRITSPIDGRIGRAMMTAGNLVNAGGSDPLLATIVAVSPIQVYFHVDDPTLQRYRNAARAKAGQPLVTPLRDLKVPFRFGLDTDAGFPHEGLLDFADNQVDVATGTIEVRGVVPNEDGRFIPGSRVRVRIPVGDRHAAIVVPDVAVGTDQDKRFLLLVGADNVVSRRNVRLGRLLDDGFRVIEAADPPLTPADRVIVDGVQRARVNYPVEPREDTSAVNPPAA